MMRKPIENRMTAVCAGVVGALALSHAATAQENVLEEIVVTATKQALVRSIDDHVHIQGRNISLDEFNRAITVGGHLMFTFPCG